VVPDVVLDWLSDTNRLTGGTDSAGFRNMICPWNPEHIAGYSPLGEGTDEYLNLRGFHCFHDSCKAHKSPEFIEMVKYLGGPDVPVFDPVADLVGRYALIETEQRVYDLTATAVTKMRGMSTSAFRDANQQIAMRGKKGGGITAFKLWIEHDQLRKLRGHHYDPAQGAITVNADGIAHLNSYLPPNHEFATGVPEIFLAHIRHLLPDENDRERFLDWLAFKLQHPAECSYACLMVAGAYGIGRSVVGEIIKRLVQGAAATLNFSDLIGIGSQAQYNDWVDSTQFVIVNEVKQAMSDFKRDHSAYEALKEIIDDSPRRDVRCTPKYRSVFYIDCYANFLMFSNHEDALQLPEGDRRFMVLRNTDKPRSPEEYKQIHGVLQDDAAIAQIYAWLMQRDVSDFDGHRPPMTAAKRLMIEQGKTLADRLVETVVENMRGDVATEKQLLQEAERVAREELSFSQSDLSKARSAMQVAIKKMAVVRPETGRASLQYRQNGKKVRQTVRIIRDVERWQLTAAAGNMKDLVSQISLNEAK
jgi:hypothetical protein